MENTRLLLWKNILLSFSARLQDMYFSEYISYFISCELTLSKKPIIYSVGLAEELWTKLQPSLDKNRGLWSNTRSYRGRPQREAGENLHLQNWDFQWKIYWKSQQGARDLLCSCWWQGAGKSFLRAPGGLLPLLLLGDGGESHPGDQSSTQDLLGRHAAPSTPRTR